MKKIITILLSVLFVFSGCVQATEIVDLSDYDKLYEEYLSAPFESIITSYSWDDAKEIDPECFTLFYFVKYKEDHPTTSPCLPSNNPNHESEIPAVDVEKLVQKYFDISTEHLRMSSGYDKEKNCYYFDGIGGGASSKVTKAKQNGDILTLDFEYYSGHDNSVLLQGTLKIKLSGKNYKYLSCTSYDVVGGEVATERKYRE